MEQSQELRGKWALVTGASRGIGAGCALALAARGADIAVHYHRQRDAAEQIVAEVGAMGRRAALLQADLAQPQEVTAMAEAFQRVSPQLDVLVLAAAATAFKRVEEIRPHHLAKTYNLVVGGMVQLVQEVLPSIGPGGRVIAISGQGTDFTLPGYALLGSAKGAMEVLVRYLARELGGRQITANCISPGVVDTDSARFYAQDTYPEFVARVAAATAVGRIGTAADVAAAVCFLASPQAGYITGQVLVVDGGLGLSSLPFMNQDTSP